MQQLRYSKHIKSVFILLDSIVFTAVFLFFYFRDSSSPLILKHHEKDLIIFGLLLIFWFLLSGRTKLYAVQRNLTYTLYMERFASHMILFGLSLFLLAKVLDSEFMKEDKKTFVLSLFGSLLLVKSLLFFLVKYARSKGFNHRNVMLLHEEGSLAVLQNILRSRKDYGYKIHSFDGDSKDLEALKKFWNDKGIHTVFLPAQSSDKSYETQLLEAAEAQQVKVILVPEMVSNGIFSYEISHVETLPVLIPAHYPLDEFGNRLLKRIADLFLSLFFLIAIASWLFPLIAILIKISSKGPVFFIQKRYGYKNRIFNCIKFRTMKINTECSRRTTLKNDERITPIGRFLRQTSLDETPQFLNVLFGQMAVVGPRPHMLAVDEHYKKKIRKYALRSRAKPGITGLAQVNGLRGEKANMMLEMKKRILADAFYIKNWSLSLDAIILFKTLILLIKGDKNAI
ncbi:exopolysaccharide biosynthesis polyprenyl glycosylphosphotransferase [Bergeyella sp. RCAD1439]|uniref:exopolysaccharide biosynthesis polyprenyl glycosylphosphotransferase n=1 Tax=Bergeyella anatis TaxID=3113737 RepID=UPI002E18C6C2|nr:exopolysaccharide biosynthesis polyprenyl glycosylphosphotransferase [Bergeyella sp. RCAD1439]